VIGGGGIRPDVTVRADTLTEGERAFTRALGSEIPTYRDVLTSYALDLKAEDGVSDPDFRVTAQMRREVVNRLREREVELPDSVVRSASDLLDRQIGYEVARYVFGREAESRRRMWDDAQIGAALKLLEGVATPEELFTRLAAQSARLSESR
jgi:hypothetical protein